ncbi:MAG TPA: dipeptide ABC transporter ATP-binding protein [Acetobacteraceae bacterium]|nr:dipeptide ABC transporter ATP-binding protein [Acetobacteraceae bacterium]
MTPAPVLSVHDLSKSFPVQRGFLRRTVAEVHAVDGVSLEVAAGETLCVVGESGCGKSTLAKLILRLIEPSGGRIVIEGNDVTTLTPEAMRGFRQRVQMVFQDPYSSLNPRLSAEQIVTEPIENFQRLDAAARRERAVALLERVGLRGDVLTRMPFEFSGGQRQRLGIARALSLRPALIIADEPVSALDVSVQAQIVNLLQDLQAELGLTYLFIAHDLGVVKHISTRVAVMYLGKVVELAEKRALYAAPRHPYTQGLIAAVPVSHPAARRRRERITGDIPSALHPPSGCRFHTRCPHVMPICREQEPTMTQPVPGHQVACHLASGA